MRKLNVTIAAMVMLGALALVARAQDKPAQTFKPDDEGFIRNWLVLDPIQLDEKASVHEEASEKPFFEKEWWTGQKDAHPKDGDKVTVNGKELTWRAFQAGDFNVDFEQTAAKSGKDTGNSLFLGVVYLIADKDMPDVKLSAGSDDSAMWKVNGKEVIRVYRGLAVDRDQDTSPALTLHKGVNVLTFAVTNGDGATGACARFLDKAGKPVKDLVVSLTPPAE